MRTVRISTEPAESGARQSLESGCTLPQGAAEADPDDDAGMIGRIVAGRYELQAVLGRGGMGIVYAGRHITLGRRVAVKVLRRDLARSTQAVARFHREAKAAASIGSEHIVEVFDFGYSDEGDAFIAMELLEGEDLGRLVRRDGALPEARVVGILRQIARALEVAHAKGIIHRDLKSENVFLTRRDGADFVKLVDFGISKMAEGDEGAGPMTSEGVLMGTPHYMAPEQASGDVEPDHRLDLYALGCIAYEMLTGRVPFQGRSAVEVVFRHVHEAPVPPSVARPAAQISAEVDALVLKALAKKREDRWASAGALLNALPAVHWSGASDPLMATASLPGVVVPASGSSAGVRRRRSKAAAILGASGTTAVLASAALLAGWPRPTQTLHAQVVARPGQPAAARAAPDAAVTTVVAALSRDPPALAIVALDAALPPSGLGDRGGIGHGTPEPPRDLGSTRLGLRAGLPRGAVPPRGGVPVGPVAVPVRSDSGAAQPAGNQVVPGAADPDGLQTSPYGRNAPR